MPNAQLKLMYVCRDKTTRKSADDRKSALRKRRKHVFCEQKRRKCEKRKTNAKDCQNGIDTHRLAWQPDSAIESCNERSPMRKLKMQLTRSWARSLSCTLTLLLHSFTQTHAQKQALLTGKTWYSGRNENAGEVIAIVMNDLSWRWWWGRRKRTRRTIECLKNVYCCVYYCNFYY